MFSIQRFFTLLVFCSIHAKFHATVGVRGGPRTLPTNYFNYIQFCAVPSMNCAMGCVKATGDTILSKYRKCVECMLHHSSTHSLNPVRVPWDCKLHKKNTIKFKIQTSLLQKTKHKFCSWDSSQTPVVHHASKKISENVRSWSSHRFGRRPGHLRSRP